MSEFNDQIIQFYKLLYDKKNSLAFSSSWAVFFDLPSAMGGGGGGGGYSTANQITNIMDLENQSGEVITGKKPWEGLEDVKDIIFNGTIKTYGWLYANRVIAPGDQYGMANHGQFALGLPKGNIATGRRMFTNVTVDFYDTNASVADYILRPWNVLVAHNGLKISTVKSTLHILPLMKQGNMNGNYPRKVFSYFNCWPTSVGDETLDHSPDRPIVKTASFAYDWYSVTNIADNLTGEPNPFKEFWDGINNERVVQENSNFNADENIGSTFF